MAAGQNGHEEWVGSAYLFLESSMDKVVLSEAYTDPQKKVAIYQALQTALSGVWLDRWRTHTVGRCEWDWVWDPTSLPQGLRHLEEKGCFGVGLEEV